MSEIASTYAPDSVEGKWYDHWIRHDCFTAHPERVSERRPAYSIVIPPPNVTGMLTLGHVLNNTIQDILARRARMLGKEVLWLPGTDHAGIATQNVVEKALRKEGVMRHRDDLGREALVAKIWDWKDKYGGLILQQLRALGTSCDWSRTRFTMDEAYSRCVSRVFVDLYKKGLIYRGKRMVNWCPVALTALSDEEVVMKPTNGTLYYFKVEVVEEPGTWLHIATTRPETIPGDTGIAVNPADSRYAHLIGKHVRRPLPREEQDEIPIVGDSAVAFDFGTGVLKVTPAHDKADFEIGQRHGLAPREVIDERGVMNATAGADLVGLDRFEARKKAVEVLREIGALEKEEPYQNNVGYSERADVPVEPRLSEQWFLRYPSQQDSRNVVSGGDMRFFPERWVKVYDHWMENLQDWCISRQIWWGHRVPAWTAEVSDKLRTFYESFPSISGGNRGTDHSFSNVAGEVSFVSTIMDVETGKEFIEVVTASEIEARKLEELGFIQDTDVLDTWFSSWLWPFATMGWPEKTDTLRTFYPTTDLVTGPDIIFFWVARMIMAGYEYLGEMPFRNVYFTGIIRDKQGRKMSKSLGNSPDPLDLIAKFGADALRLGVMRSAPLGQDVLFDEKNVELGRNFCTKLWNAARFRQMQGGEWENEIDPAQLTSDDKWILLRLDSAIREVSRALDEYRFTDATQALYRFFWSEYCDWYLEASKAALTTELKVNTLAVIDFVLGHTLRLFHPFLPFITEELWQDLGFAAELPPHQGGTTIMTAPWPKPLTGDEREYFGLKESDERYAAAKYEVVNLGRGLRRDFNIASSKRVRFVLRPSSELNPHDTAVLRLLLNADPLDVVDASWVAPKGTPTALTPLGELFLPLEGLIDVAAERARLDKEIAKAEDELAKVRTKLSDPNFAGKVPPAVLEEHQQREINWADKLAQLQRMREALEG
jgi:valyl-tRNA synthetase